MNAANVVISFPKDRVVRMFLPPSARKEAERTKKFYADKTVEDHATGLVDSLAMSGVDISTDEFQKNYALTIECLRSTVYKSFGLKHALQPAMKEMIKSIQKDQKS